MIDGKSFTSKVLMWILETYKFCELTKLPFTTSPFLM